KRGEGSGLHQGFARALAPVHRGEREGSAGFDPIDPIPLVLHGKLVSFAKSGYAPGSWTCSILGLDGTRCAELRRYARATDHYLCERRKWSERADWREQRTAEIVF
ncbi:MAG: hypothetical protein D6712_01255, partial [Chloroflexi bacterium]